MTFSVSDLNFHYLKSIRNPIQVLVRDINIIYSHILTSCRYSTHISPPVAYITAHIFNINIYNKLRISVDEILLMKFSIVYIFFLFIFLLLRYFNTFARICWEISWHCVPFIYLCKRNSKKIIAKYLFLSINIFFKYLHKVLQ